MPFGGTALAGSVGGGGGAQQADIDAAIAALVASAPGALDTLDELAAALGDDASFAATMTTALAAKISTATADAKYLFNKEGGKGPITAHGNMGATETMDLATANLHTGNLDGATCAISFTGATTATDARLDMLLSLTLDAAATTWPTGTGVWINGAPPTAAMKSGTVILVTILTQDAFTNWRGSWIAAPQVTIPIQLFDHLSTVVTGFSTIAYPIGPELAGFNVTAVRTQVYGEASANPTTVKPWRRRAATNVAICSTNPVIDTGEFLSDTGTAGVIDAANDDLLSGDLILFEITAAGTSVEGLWVFLTCTYPG